MIAGHNYLPDAVAPIDQWTGAITRAKMLIYLLENALLEGVNQYPVFLDTWSYTGQTSVLLVPLQMNRMGKV